MTLTHISRTIRERLAAVLVGVAIRLLMTGKSRKSWQNTQITASTTQSLPQCATHTVHHSGDLTIREMVEEAYQNSLAHGFHDTPATFGDRIALVHSELSEALEAFRVLDNDAHDAIREPLYKGSGGGLVRYGKEYHPDTDDCIGQFTPDTLWLQ